MKKIFRKRNLFALLIVLTVVFTAIGCAPLKDNAADYTSEYATKGVYTPYEQTVSEITDNILKDVQLKVSTDGKHLLMVSAFDHSILKMNSLYYIGFKYTFNGAEVDTSQLEGAKKATFYGAVALNTSDGVIKFGAKDVYGNDELNGYSLIVHEIEFETSFEQEEAYLENVRSFITEVVANDAGGYEKIDGIESPITIDNSAYRVVNGNFENGLEGWTLTNTSGEKPFAGIDNKTTFWSEGYAMNNVGNYFSAYANGAEEVSQGRLASSYFTVNSEYATYMLGGAGNQNVYITVENKAGEVLALYRNTEFADFPEGEFSLEEKRAMIGNTVFLANFVTYKVSIADFMGEEIRFVINDYASDNWGVVFFDELNTYYAIADMIPQNAILAENLLADKTALNAELALEITEQGDYTLESYNAYVAKLNAAKALVSDIAVTQATVNEAVTALEEAREALAVRPVEEVADANKAFRLTSGDSKEITVSDYVNDNGLSSITYAVKANNELVTLSEIANGKFTITAGAVSEATTVTVTITVSYNGTQKLTVEIEVRITNDMEPLLYGEQIVKSYDIYDLQNKENITIDFAENVNNVGNLALTYSAKHNGSDIVLEGASYTFAFGSYTEAITNEIFTVTLSYVVNGKEDSIEYTYTLAMQDTSAYRVANGNFENGLEGWTLTNTSGEKPFAGIDSKTTFWNEGYAMNNVGNYFSSYAEGAEEVSQGNLTSSYFTVNSEYATYMLGGAGNHNVYITIENKAGEVLALYRNTQFKDLPTDRDYSLEEKRAMIGNTVFLANFVTYKVDLTAFAGQEIRFVIHDYASSGWGVIFFDELNTYYASVDAISENAILAENLLADKRALNAEIELEVTEQGDYTLESYNAYVEKLNAAKALVSDIAVTQATVNEAVTALEEARKALAVRPVEEVANANKAFRLNSGNDKEITVSDYVNDNGLSSITYAVKANNELVTLSEIANGKFTITAGTVSEATTVTVTIAVSYNGTQKLTVEIEVRITNDMEPVLYGEQIVKSYDIYDLENKENITIDFAENVDNAGNLALTYSAKYNGNDIVLDGSSYTFAFGSYTDAITNEIFTVTVSYVANGKAGSIEYAYTLAMKDSTAYRLVNGGFENGLDGWTKVGNIGDVSANTNYWVEEWENNGKGYEFGMDGDKMFSAYAPGALESAVGTLTSSTFKVGGSGFVTFKVGAMKDANYVYVDVVDAETKRILVRYSNNLWAEYTNGLKSGCTLIAYKADLSEFKGKEVFFRISDNADSGYGLFFADSFNTYYEEEPTNDFNLATQVGYAVSGTIYDLFNGGFEMGDVQGWWNIGEIGVVTNASGYWGSNISYGKEGDYLFTGVESFGADTMREGNRGSLTSSTFEIGGIGYISFMLGGGENELCYVQVIDATTNEVLARYHQQEMQEAVLKTYVANLSAYIGRTVRIQVVDYAENGWGCVSFDNVITYYASNDALPAGITANDIKGNLKYTIDNGSFETGNLDGWTMNITEAGAHNTLGWVLDGERSEGWYTTNDGRKDGTYLFSFYHKDGINCENTKGTLTSSTFSLKQGAFVSFRFGGAGTRDVNIQLCRTDGSVIATFYNEAAGKVNTEMYPYYYQYNGAEVNCFFRVVDNSTSNYGCFVVDDFRVNLESAPEGFIAAIQ